MNKKGMNNAESINLNEENPKKKRSAKRSKQPANILSAMEQIVEAAEDSMLSDDFFKQCQIPISFVAKKLNITPMQAALLAIFVDRSEDSRIMPSEIARYIGCRTTRILILMEDMDRLDELKYIRAARRRDSLSFSVPAKVLAALRNNEPYIHEEEPLTGTLDFFDRVRQLMKEKDDNQHTYSHLRDRFEEMLEEIKQTVFARELGAKVPNGEDRALFIFMAHLYVQNNDDNIVFGDIEDLYDDDELPTWVRRELRNRSSVLFEANLIENPNEDGMARGDAFKLTDFAKETLLCELDVRTASKSQKGLITPDTLAEKTLIYNSREGRQISELSSILAQDRFSDVQDRLQQAGMRSGFCCIFYGAPGTGKTESVYQIARLTGRAILRVDVDKIKSCWVGESEKNVKGLFDRYRVLCRDSELKPILLFNEADAVLGVRMEGASKAVDKMENSLQNIILQEMETLDGIMIATTNLTTNLDKAFERRFLYKVRFDKPTLEARAGIWQSMLKGLDDVQALKLARLFDLSGGEIENIVRKHTVNAILSGKEIVDFDAIVTACREERIAGADAVRIGFAS